MAIDPYFDPSSPEVVTSADQLVRDPPPPQAGVLPTGLNKLYITLPHSLFVAGKGLSNGPYSENQRIDTLIRLNKMNADRKDLVDGRRVYRVEERDAWIFNKDAYGYFFLGLGSSTTAGVQYRLLDTDTTVGVMTLRDWYPVN